MGLLCSPLVWLLEALAVFSLFYSVQFVFSCSFQCLNLNSEKLLQLVQKGLDRGTSEANNSGSVGTT